MLFLRVEEGAGEAGEQEEARGEQEVGRGERLEGEVVHGAVHRDEDEVLDAVDEPDGAVNHRRLVLVDRLSAVEEGHCIYSTVIIV